MIRSRAALEAALERGAVVARMDLMGEQSGFRLCLADTNETVHGSALKSVVKAGVAKVLATDIAGEPYQWGRA